MRCSCQSTMLVLNVWAKLTAISNYRMRPASQARAFCTQSACYTIASNLILSIWAKDVCWWIAAAWSHQLRASFYVKLVCQHIELHIKRAGQRCLLMSRSCMESSTQSVSAMCAASLPAHLDFISSIWAKGVCWWNTASRSHQLGASLTLEEGKRPAVTSKCHYAATFAYGDKLACNDAICINLHAGFVRSTSAKSTSAEWRYFWQILATTIKSSLHSNSLQENRWQWNDKLWRWYHQQNDSSYMRLNVTCRLTFSTAFCNLTCQVLRQ